MTTGPNPHDLNFHYSQLISVLFQKASVTLLPNQSLKSVFQECILRAVNCQMMSWLMMSNQVEQKHEFR